MEEAGKTPEQLRRSPSSQAGRSYSHSQIQSPASTSPVASLLNASYTTDSRTSRTHTANSHILSDRLHFLDSRSPPTPIFSDPEDSLHTTYTAVEEARLNQLRSSSPLERRGNYDTSSHYSNARRVSDSPNTARKASPISRKNGTSLGSHLVEVSPSTSFSSPPITPAPPYRRTVGVSTDSKASSSHLVEVSPSTSISSPPITPAPPYRRTVGVSTDSRASSSILEFNDLQRGRTVDKPKSTVVASGLVPPSPSREELLDRLINLTKESRGGSAGVKNFMFTPPL